MTTLQIISTIFGLSLIIFLQFFAQDLIEKTKFFKNRKKKGEKYWEWATTPPYFTFRKIIYWIVVGTVLSITIYLGIKIETMS